MKRNLDLVRKILIYLEKKQDEKMMKSLELEGYESKEIMYHLILMDQAGLLRCEREVSSSTPDRAICVYPFSLSWQGHEFLEASRNESTWNKAKRIVIDKTGGLSVDVLKALLISMAKESVDL